MAGMMRTVTIHIMGSMDIMTFWYLLTEAGSVIENVGKMGVAAPGWLRKAIAAMKDKIDKDMDKQADRQEDKN